MANKDIAITHKIIFLYENAFPLHSNKLVIEVASSYFLLCHLSNHLQYDESQHNPLTNPG
jgi:hypothetical protein